MFNEKLYIFLWWWILDTAIITAAYFLIWAVRMCKKSGEVNYVIKYIKFSDEVPQFDERLRRIRAVVPATGRHVLDPDGAHECRRRGCLESRQCPLQPLPTATLFERAGSTDKQRPLPHWLVSGIGKGRHRHGSKKRSASCV